MPKEVHIGLRVSQRLGSNPTLPYLRALENLENRDSDCPSGDTEAAMAQESPSKADFPFLVTLWACRLRGHITCVAREPRVEVCVRVVLLQKGPL